MKNRLYIILGWGFVILGTIGAILPILPTTPFLIVALALFSKSSPRFHKMLLESSFFGAILRKWEENKTISRKHKNKAFLLIIITFSISICAVDKLFLRLALGGICVILICFIWRLKEAKTEKVQNSQNNNQI